jgi:uncharacterized GH25 family protein
VLVIARGYEPTFFTKVDPAAGRFEARLQPRPATNLPPSHIVCGRVVDEEGEPVENAVVSLDGLRQGDTTHGSPPEGTDPLAVTDERGEFFLSSREAFDAMNLEVEARRFARKQFNDVRGGTNRHVLTITEGAALTGRLLKNGKPLKGVALGVVSKDRSIENFTGDFVIGTMDNGDFLFSNLPPNRHYYLYGIMSSLTNHGAVPLRLVHVEGDGSTKNVGELNVVPGLRLAGQVKLADGSKLPPNTRLSVSSDEAWDVLAVELGADGLFDLRNVPPGTHNVGVRVKGYRLAAANASLDTLNPFHLVGQLNTDKTNLTVLLEPGDNLRSEGGGNVPGERPQDLPLAGIEEKRRIANAWTLNGRVIDAETSEPLTRFRVTPGRRSSAHSPWTNWQYQRATDQSNGVYELGLSRNGGIAVLQIDADAYLPAVSDPLEPGARGWDFKLRKGSGPAGVLLLPDGKPAADVQVIYIGPGEQAGLRATGQLSAYSLRPGSETRTDSNGRFRFAPKLGDAEIVASSSNGFIRVSAADLATNGMLTLQPWARVSGRLMRDGQPLPPENVDLQPPVHHSGGPWVNFHGTRTDEEGWFTIENVPPGEWQLTTRLKSGGGGWTNQRQHNFTAKPGESVDVGTIQKTDSTTALR